MKSGLYVSRGSWRFKLFTACWEQNDLWLPAGRPAQGWRDAAVLPAWSSWTRPGGMQGGIWLHLSMQGGGGKESPKLQWGPGNAAALGLIPAANGTSVESWGNSRRCFQSHRVIQENYGMWNKILGDRWKTYVYWDVTVNCMAVKTAITGY